MKVFVISLKHSIERRSRIQKLLDEQGIEFEFFDAIDASVKDFKYSNKRAPNKTLLRLGYHLLDNEVACFASHFCLWEKCIELNEPILILEDNCDLMATISSYQSLFENLVNEHHFIKLFSMFKKKYSPIKKINTSAEIIYYHDRTCGAQGYLISPYGAMKFVENAQQFIEPADNYMEKPWRHGILTYSFKPDLVCRAKIKSTIGSNRKNKKKLPLWRKSIIEIIRVYEELQYKIVNVRIKKRHKSNAKN